MKPDFDRVVRGMYGALAEDLRFDQILLQVASSFRAHLVGLVETHADDSRNRLHLVGSMRDGDFLKVVQDYNARWSGQNIWMERALPGLRTRGYESGDRVLSDRELVGTDFYRHFLRDIDVRHAAGVRLELGAETMAIGTVNRDASAGAFTESDMDLLARLQPHLANVYTIYRRLTGLSTTSDSLRAGFDRSPIGMMILDEHGLVQDHNAEADRLLRARKGIALDRGGSLRFDDDAQLEHFGSVMQRMRRKSPGSRPGTQLLVSPTERRRGSLVMHLCAVPRSAVALMQRQGRALAFLHEVERPFNRTAGAEMLQALLSLTPAESRTVLLLRDQGEPERVAESLGVAVSTVRTHLKHAFRKAGVRRQSDLVRLVDRIVATAPN